MPPHFLAGLVGLCQSDYSHYTAPSGTPTAPQSDPDWALGPLSRHCARDGRVGGRHAAAAVRCRRIPDSAGPCALCRAAAGLADFESATTLRRLSDDAATSLRRSVHPQSRRRVAADSAPSPRRVRADSILSSPQCVVVRLCDSSNRSWAYGGKIFLCAFGFKNLFPP